MNEKQIQRRMQELQDKRDAIDDELEHLRESLAAHWVKEGKTGRAHYIEVDTQYGSTEGRCWCPHGEDHHEDEWPWTAENGKPVTV